MAKVDYHRVFRGSNQDTYCNGDQHVALMGDSFGKHPQRDNSPHAKIAIDKCTCRPDQKAPEASHG